MIQLIVGVKANPEKLIALKDNFPHLVPLELKLRRDDPKCIKFAEGLRELYFQDRPPSFETVEDYVEVGNSASLYFPTKIILFPLSPS